MIIWLITHQVGMGFQLPTAPETETVVLDEVTSKDDWLEIVYR